MIFSIVLLNLKTTFFRIFELIRVTLRYYPKFLSIDFLLASHYLFGNPHQISKKFLKQKGAKEIYAYGETPLTTLDRIARICGILSKDIVYDLGCGPGRTTFWLKQFIKCKVVGIDYLPTFIRRAESVRRYMRLNGIEFHEEDMLKTDFSQATVIYLYGTCLDDETIESLIERFSSLKTGTKIITVSYPLTDFSQKFCLEKQFMARFPWGKAEVFLNLKN